MNRAAGGAGRTTAIRPGGNERGRTSHGERARWARRLGLTALAACAATLLATAAHAQPMSRDKVPPALRDWIPWVLEGAGDLLCPTVDEKPVCIWPGELALDLGESGGEFVVQVRADRASTLELPGSTKHWPQDVEVDGEPAVVLEQGGDPAVRLAAGEHEIKGRFRWKAIPEVLDVPDRVARVRLVLREKPIANPKRSKEGGVWLEAADVGSNEPERLDVEVLRRIDDGVPLLVTTHLKLRVAGKAREVSFGKPLLDGTVPIGIDSKLALRLEPSGELFGQVRAGEHEVVLRAYHAAAPESLAIGTRAAPWPDHEIWAWAPNPQLRQVAIEGGIGIDPSRTSLPTSWHSLQALRVSLPGAIKLVTTRRGEPEPPPNQLALRREMWLDLDGAGFTVRDHFTGKMTRTWRLDLEAGILGRAIDHGDHQLITVSPQTNRSGVELRTGDVQLLGEWRLARAATKLPAVGWSEDVRKLETTVHLPPGWQLLFTTGVDDAPRTWVTDWALLDLFVMVIAAVAAWKLLGVGAALLALLTLALSHGSSMAPQLVWIVMLAAIALLRKLDSGRARQLARAAWLVTTVVLVVLGGGYAIDELRAGFYPVAGVSPNIRDAERWMEEQESRQIAEDNADNREGGTGTRAKGEEGSMGNPNTKLQVNRYGVAGPPTDDPHLARQAALRDAAEFGMIGLISPGASMSKAAVSPNAIIQTGPGVPDWRWASSTLQWSGAVDRGQAMRLYLLSPNQSALLAALRALLIAGLAWLLVRRTPFGREPPKGVPSAPARKPAPKRAATAVAAALLGLLMPAAARAQTPPAELLEELKTRLTRPAECQPSCVAVPRLGVLVEQQALELEAEVHAGAAGSYKLPGPAATWVPRAIEVDGKPSLAVALLDDGFLHVRVEPGRHRVRVRGAIAADSLTLTLGTTPRRVTVDATGWQVDGLNEDGTVEGSIQLSRLADARPSTPGPDGEPPPDDEETQSLPPWLAVERTFTLGVQWTVATRLRRVSPTGVPIVIRFALLPGEKVVSAGPIVEDNDVVLSLGRDDAELSWTSSLEPRDAIELKAPEGKPWTEQWTLECSPIWQCQTDGIAPFRRMSEGGRWAPKYSPWPGEAVRWVVHQPASAAGPSATIDQATLEIRPGARLLDVSLLLQIRSSTGGMQKLTIPSDAKVQKLAMSGTEQPLRRDGDVVSVSLVPGTQQVSLVWQQPAELGLHFRIPRVDLGGPAVNVNVRLLMPPSPRWVIAVGGPSWGPQILLWGQLALLLGAAVALSRLRRSPLTALEWSLLAVGMTQVPALVAALMAGWFFLVEWRKRWTIVSPNRRNAAQIGFVVATLAFVGVAVRVAYENLAKQPPMPERLDGSYRELLWYVERIESALPSAWVVSTPGWVWQLLMLGWSLWLAWLLARWMRTAWASFTTDGAWRRWQITLPFKRKLATASVATGAAQLEARSDEVPSEEKPSEEKPSASAPAEKGTRAPRAD